MTRTERPLGLIFLIIMRLQKICDAPVYALFELGFNGSACMLEKNYFWLDLCSKLRVLGVNMASAESIFLLIGGKVYLPDRKHRRLFVISIAAPTHSPTDPLQFLSTGEFVFSGTPAYLLFGLIPCDRTRE